MLGYENLPGTFVNRSNENASRPQKRVLLGLAWILLIVPAYPIWALDVECWDESGSVAVQCVVAGATVDCDAPGTEYISYYAAPAGSGPFPGVLYNHGGAGTALGGDPLESAAQLACSGYIGYAKRRVLLDIDDSYFEAEAGLDELLDLGDSDLDPDRIGVMGYSRGGLYSLRLTELRSGAFAAAVLMASAPGGCTTGTPNSCGWTAPGGAGNTVMDGYLEDVDLIDPGTAFLVMVAENDNPAGNNPMNDLVDLSATVSQTLADEEVTPVFLELRPAWPPDNLSAPFGGHQLFESVEDNGQELGLEEQYYWRKVIDHFDAHMAAASAAPGLAPVPILLLGAALTLGAAWKLRGRPIL